MLSTQHKAIGLDTEALQLLYRVLGWLCLELACSREIRYICKVYAYCTTTELPLQLADSLEEWKTLDVTYSTTDLGNHKVELLLSATALHLALDLVCDVRDNLHCLAKILTTTLLLNNLAVDAACCEGVPTCSLDICETLVVTEVEIGLVTIDCYITLTVLLWVKSTRRNVDIWVEFLDCNLVSSRLQ